MKKTLLFCLLFVSTFIYAQKKYAVFGIDKGYYPQAKTFMLGVNLQF